MKIVIVFLFFLAQTPSAQAQMPSVIGGIVRSDKWVIKRKLGLEEFIGNVSYKNPGYELFCNWALYNKNKREVILKGNVRGKKFWEDGAITKAKSDIAEYNDKTKKGKLYPKNSNGEVYLFHWDKKQGNWESFSKLAEFSEKEFVLTLTGDVKIKSQTSNSISDIAIYRRKLKEMELLGSPVIWGVKDDYNFAIVGNKAKAADFYEKIKVSENVKGWVRPVEKNGN